MRHERLGENRDRWSTERGSLEIWRRSPEVLVQTLDGHGEACFVDPMIERLDAMVAESIKASVFDDWEKATRYDPETRSRLTAWTKANRGALEETVILVRSKLFAMGVNVANLAVGGRLKVVSDRCEFETMLADRLGVDPASLNDVG